MTVGAMYHDERDDSEEINPLMRTEILVFVDEHGMNVYYPEDDYLVQEPYVFADDHMAAVGRATFKGVLHFGYNTKDGHPVLSMEQRRQWNVDGHEHDQIDAGNELVLAFDAVVNTFMGTTEQAKRQALDWLEQMYDPEYASTLRGN